MLAGLIASGLVIYLFSPHVNQVPGQQNVLGIVLLYLSLFTFFVGVFSLFLFWLRKKSYEEDLLCEHMGVSLRQGILLSLMVVVLLLLQSFRVLVWWDALLAIGAVMMIELYFLAR